MGDRKQFLFTALYPSFEEQIEKTRMKIHERYYSLAHLVNIEDKDDLEEYETYEKKPNKLHKWIKVVQNLVKNGINAEEMMAATKAKAEEALKKKEEEENKEILLKLEKAKSVCQFICGMLYFSRIETNDDFHFRNFDGNLYFDAEAVENQKIIEKIKWYWVNEDLQKFEFC